MPRIPQDFADLTLERLLEDFSSKNCPIPISFRDLLKQHSPKRKGTHDIHSYPARLLLNIPSFFLSTSLSQPHDTVLDPFCGSGTVLLEAILANRNAFGSDANPLARLISTVKTTPLCDAKLSKALSHINKRLSDNPKEADVEVVNKEYWFYPHVQRDLAKLRYAIDKVKDRSIRDFFKVALSASIKEVSLADPRLSVPVKLKADQYPEGHPLRAKTIQRISRLKRIDVNSAFNQKARTNIERMKEFNSRHTIGHLIGIENDARNLSTLDNESIDFIITSPPYLGAQKYIRASSLQLNWLGLCGPTQLRGLEEKNIGREHHNSELTKTFKETGIPEADKILWNVFNKNRLRAHIGWQYLMDMRESMKEISRVLKDGKFLILIAGESTISGIPFPTPDFLASMAQEFGLIPRLSLVDTIRSRSLMTKRNQTAGRIDTEAILLFQKDHNKC